LHAGLQAGVLQQNPPDNARAELGTASRSGQRRSRRGENFEALFRLLHPVAFGSSDLRIFDVAVGACSV